MKYVTVKLTEDQARQTLIALSNNRCEDYRINAEWPIIEANDSEKKQYAYVKRIETAVKQALANAKS